MDPEIEGILERFDAVTDMLPEEVEKIEALRQLAKAHVKGVMAILPEHSRNRSLFLTALEEAAMWAVKGATHGRAR